MRDEYDFSKGKRRALIAQTGKTRITIHIDNAVLDEFRTRAERAGRRLSNNDQRGAQGFSWEEPASSD